MFVVMVTHNTGHGEVSYPILVTKSIRKAVGTARGIESLGYQFYNKETGVVVFRLEQGRSYPKGEFKWFENQIPSQAVIFYRWPGEIINGRVIRWAEDWYNKELQALAGEIRL
ncbi:MAG: hypothetical protein Q8L57_02090 [bacterium]|nr:hypothetical protein [bacterium]